MVRSYLEWLANLPWTLATEDQLDLKHAANVLEENHYGLPKVKERILEYLAVHKLASGKQRSPVICFVGPPGVGKTSLGRSIAQAIGRNFVGISLGGIRDEAEIRGHRRPYIRALPGRILQTMPESRHGGSGLHARRDRQGRHRLPGRPVYRAARGARPGAKPRLFRSLPRPALQLVQSNVVTTASSSTQSHRPFGSGWKSWTARLRRGGTSRWPGGSSSGEANGRRTA